MDILVGEMIELMVGPGHHILTQMFLLPRGLYVIPNLLLIN